MGDKVEKMNIKGGNVNVYTGPKEGSKLLGGHSGKIVGWGTEKGTNFWIISNSWSDKWGNAGYFKMERGKNVCKIEDNIIIEFAYNPDKPDLWKWEPLRIRYDKTSELRSGVKNFGNAYHVANANWQSIHNPVSVSILTSGNGVTINNDEDVYYNNKNKTSETKSLRDFHNLYVKSMLINKVSKSGYSLIDYAVGKGGDLPKWVSANLNFVLGIDVSKDNIENRLDGVCARYLNYAQQLNIIPKALFLHGNSILNIKDGAAFYDDKSKQIIKALFGEGTKNEVLLGKGVYANYGISKNGFNISSIQFAIHYMFENEAKLDGFIKNVKECTALEG